MRIFNLFLILFITANLFANDGGGSHVTGNGGFVYDNSKNILRIAVAELQKFLTNTDHPYFKKYPERRLIALQAITNLKESPTIEATNTNLSSQTVEPLWFTYGKNEEGKPYVEVLKPFYEHYSSFGAELYPLAVVDVKRKLLHETYHHFVEGFSEPEAKAFAEEMIPMPKNMLIDLSNVTVVDNFVLPTWHKRKATKVMDEIGNHLTKNYSCVDIQFTQEKSTDGKYEIYAVAKCVDKYKVYVRNIEVDKGVLGSVKFTLSVYQDMKVLEEKEFVINFN